MSGIVVRYNEKGIEYTLVYSPDDGGYYWERYPGWATSGIYITKYSACVAFASDRIKWNKPDQISKKEKR